MAPRKRTAGSGSITRRNGRYTAQVTDPRTGRRRSVGTFASRREAEVAIAERATTPGPGEAAQMPLGEYLIAWAEGRAAYVGAIQADRASKDVARYVAPYPIARVPLDELTASDFRQHYAMLAARGGKGGRPLGDWSVFGVDKTLRTAIHTALADGEITRDPMPKQRVKVARHERPWTNAASIRRLIALVRLRDPDLEVAVRLGALYGFRRGEISGLRWADVGRDRVRIHATRIVANGRAIDGPPKTPGSAATVLIDDATAAALEAHRRRRTDLLGERLPDDEHVYVTPLGEPLYPDTLTERFRRLVIAFNVTHDATPLPHGFSFHCLRHSFASNLIAAGESTLVVAAAGRWESAAMVERVYGHLAPSTVADAVARLAAAVGD